jgi:V8-like Glu-specific endopeptidase
VQKDRRVVADRLDSMKNPGREDESFLNAVGAVWPYGVVKAAACYDASTGQTAATGFLIDRCHVLTNMHVVYSDGLVVGPAAGNPVAFALGQTRSDKDKGALQGLKFLLPGTVVAHGDTIIIDGRVHNPENDWAVIRLASNVDGTVEPMTIAAVEPTLLPRNFSLSSAGYPADHRDQRPDGFKLKDLWESAGRVVAVVPVSTMGTLVRTTIQTTPGNSGGPIYGDFAGQKHVVVGMVQGIAGNGIDVSDRTPNVQLLFTRSTLSNIAGAQAQTPCP